MQIAAFYWYGTPLPFRPRARFASAGPLLMHSSESTSVGVRFVDVLGFSVPAVKLNEIIDAICGAPQAERSLVHEGTAAKLKLALDSRAGQSLRVGPALSTCLCVVLDESAAITDSAAPPLESPGPERQHGHGSGLAVATPASGDLRDSRSLRPSSEEYAPGDGHQGARV